MTDYYLYRFRSESFNKALEDFSLIYQYTMSQMTPIITLLRKVAGDLRQSTYAYQIGSVEDLSTAGFESVGLNLLMLINRGVGLKDGSGTRLKAVPTPPEWTIGNLAGDKARFAHWMCIEKNVNLDISRFVIHLSMLYCSYYLHLNLTAS